MAAKRHPCHRYDSCELEQMYVAGDGKQIARGLKVQRHSKDPPRSIRGGPASNDARLLGSLVDRVGWRAALGRHGVEGVHLVGADRLDDSLLIRAVQRGNG